MSPRKFDRFMVDVEIAGNLKLVKLTDAEWRCHVSGVLPIAAKSPIRGCMLVGDENATEEHVAHQARKSVGIARSTMRKLRSVGILYHDEEYGCERVHDFEDWNPAPKQDATNAERQRRFRERRNAARNGVTTQRITPNITPTEVEGEVEEVANAPSSAAGADTLDLASPSLHPHLAEVLPILQAAVSPSGTRLAVEPAGIDSMLKANPGKDGVTGAHEVAAMVAEGRNRTWTAGSLLGAVLRRQTPAKPDERSEREQRRTRRHAAMRSMMDGREPAA